MSEKHRVIRMNSKDPVIVKNTSGAVIAILVYGKPKHKSADYKYILGVAEPPHTKTEIHRDF